VLAPGSPSGPLQKAKLAAADGIAGDEFGSAVALSGSTAVVGAPQKNSNKGAAYVFVRSGTTWSQQAELTASDGVSNDDFAVSVAVSGSTAVVGADGKSSSTGAAYVFVRSGTTWSQQAELAASDATPGDAFGISVSISGSTALVGAYGKSSGSGAGAAYVFVSSGTAWSQQAELIASDGVAGDNFGVAVSVYKSTAVVGATDNNSQTGAAYVFVRSGTSWTQQTKLTAADGAHFDAFGSSVAVSGATVVVGAELKNSDAGAAYVFVRSGSAWSQQAKVTASDAASNNFFGHAVALSGSTAVVGAYGKNSEKGVAYAFVRSGATWYQQAELSASDAAAFDVLGASVSISGSTVVAGAPFKNSDTGAAYVFVLPSQQAELTASDGVSGDNLGVSVSVSGSIAVVGAYSKNSNTGAAYVFVRSGTTWTQQAKLTASDAALGDSFGISVAVSTSIAVVGAALKNSGTGAAYVFVLSGTTWTQQAKLTASDGVSNDYFGYSVAVSGTTAVVGAVIKNSGTGAAYVFVQSGTIWSQQAKLTASDGAANDLFGDSVAVSGSTAVVGARQNVSTGAAYVFVRSGTTWSQQAKLTASDGAPLDNFGIWVAVSGSTTVVGAFGKNSNTGAAYVFVRSGTTWFPQAELTASDGVSGDIFGVSVALSGSTAVVGAYGKNSNTGAAYVFVRSGTTWTQQAKLITSDGASNDYFGVSVALSGSTAVVGAQGKNSSTGAAYVFVLP
jgi:hypothetical protein